MPARPLDNRILVDTDVILDLLTAREPHGRFAKDLFDQIGDGRWQAFATPVTFANLYYLLRKVRGSAGARKSLTQLRGFVDVLPMGPETVDSALSGELKDFEDGLQVVAAEAAGIKYVVTRNENDFRRSRLTITSPRQLVG